MKPLTLFNSRILMTPTTFNSTINKGAEHFRTYTIGASLYGKTFELKAYDAEDAFYLYSPTTQWLFHANGLREIEEIVSLLEMECAIKNGPSSNIDYSLN